MSPWNNHINEWSLIGNVWVIVYSSGKLGIDK